MSEPLAGRTAIVTGAGSGVGQAIARRFLSAGARVMLADSDEGSLDSTREDMGGAEGAVAHFCCDLAGRLSVNNLLAATLDAFGDVDILVNAGRMVAAGDFLDLDPADYDRLHVANVRSVMVLSQAIARRMIQQREEDGDFRGTIVNVSSIAARRTVPELFAYSVTCAALDQMTRSLAASLAAHRIRVNGLALGAVMTTDLRQALRSRQGLRDEMIGVTPLGRIGDAEEAASAALFLASDEASFITGQIVAVDGGRTVLDPLASPVR